MKALILYVVFLFVWTALLFWQGTLSSGISVPTGIMYVGGLTMSSLVCNGWSKKNG